MEKTVSIVVIIIALVASVYLISIIFSPKVVTPEKEPISVAQLLENPFYEEVRIYGEVSLLGELYCHCFELNSGGEKLTVWYGTMVEEDGRERQPVSIEDVENGQKIIVSGQLRKPSGQKLINNFWASKIEID